MPTTSNLQAEVEEFFGSYRRAFERQDAASIADHFAYPAHVTSDVGTVALVAVTSKAEWSSKVEDLLLMYKNIGFHSATILEVAVTELSSLLVQARVHWALNDASGALLYDFGTTYTLGRFDHRLKITSVVSHNEIPRYRACLRGLHDPLPVRAAALTCLAMTRDEFLKDCEDAVRLLSDLAAGDVLAEEMRGKLASLRSDARAISPHELQRYAEAIDWGRQHDPIVVQRLALVLLRITVGLAKELDSFQHTAKG